MEKSLHWGLIGAGRVSHDFAICLQTLKQSGHEIVAVADIVPKKAEEFAMKHNIPKFYDSIAEIGADPSVDIAYIGTLNPAHFACSKAMLEAGKHVLCEKPMCTHPDLARQLMDLARKKKKFLMEAIASRHIPAYFHLRKLLEEKVIGEPKFVQATIGRPMTSNQRVVDRKLGGSITLDVGVYCIQLASLVYKGIRPKEIKATAVLNETGADEMAMITLDYGGNRFASIVLHSDCQLYESAVVSGPTENIRIWPFVDYPSWVESSKEKKEFPLPKIKPTIYDNSAGLIYEAQEVKRCIDHGLLESPFMTHDESIIIAEITEEIGKQIGVDF